MKRITLLCLVALSVVHLSCGDSGPTAGELAVSFESPSSDDWALRFTVTSTQPQTVETLTATCSGCQAFVRNVSDTELRVILYGPPIPAGEVARLSVSDTRTPSGYSLALLEVAGGDLADYPPATRSLSISANR
jgi:hypothetical protein